MLSYLSTSRVDADGAVQLLLGDSTFHGCTEALRHLSCIWAQVVEPDDSKLQNKKIHHSPGTFRRSADRSLFRFNSLNCVKESYTVQFIADDLGVAFVVVPAGHSELQRPEETVEHLNTPIREKQWWSTTEIEPAAFAMTWKLLVFI